MNHEADSALVALGAVFFVAAMTGAFSLGVWLARLDYSCPT